MGQWTLENEGDNIEFTAVDTGDYTIFLQHNENTSADDTEFVKYPNNTTTARKLTIRVNENSNLVQLNERVLTNPATIIADKAPTEIRNIPIIGRFIIRINTANTTVKVRWF